MWIKLLLLVLYLLFLFILSRLLEAASWYQETGALFTSFVVLDPISLSIKKLKQILDSRGISYSGVVEKQELLELVELSGQPTSEELADHESSSKTPTSTTQFSWGSHFYEEVEDAKNSAWLVQVVVNDKPLVSENVWSDIVDKVSNFGLRTGVFKCSVDQRLCNRKRWTTPRLILAIPQGNTAKEDVILHSYISSSTTESIMQWIRKHLASSVTKIRSYEELMRWMQYTNNDKNSEIRVIFFTFLQSCPMFLSSLAIKLNGRVRFGMADTSKDSYKKYNKHDLHFYPTYLVVTPEKTFTFGHHKAECYNFKSMELFLKTFTPEINDIFMWSLLLVNALASFELFFMYSQVWKHLLLYVICVIKYNSVLFLLWLLILALNQFPFMSTCTDILLKCLRIVSGSCLASIIRSDYKNLYSYTFLFTTFVFFASVAGFILKKFQWIQEDETWTFSSAFFRPVINLTRPVAAQNLNSEINMDFLAERFVIPNLWLQPVIPMDYFKDLNVWKYQGWCKRSDTIGDMENRASCFCDDESANMPTFRQVEDSVPNSSLPGDNLSLNNASLSDIESSISSLSTHPNCINEKVLSADPSSLMMSSANISSSTLLNNKDPEMSDFETAPKWIIEANDCSICLEKYKCDEFLCGLPCGHSFHKHCIMAWLTRDNHCCPVCRWPAYKSKCNISHPHSQ